MQILKFFSEINKNDGVIAGGKGASLGEMTQAGIPVPPGFVILAATFDHFLEQTNLKQEIAARLAEVDPTVMASIERVSVLLREAIHHASMPENIAQEILQAFDELDAEFVAVRSSATAEDSSIASWAGELETYLNTTRDTVLEKVKQCWSSLFTPRAIFYRFEKNLNNINVSVAVVIQKMIQSEVSGIAFSVHPVTQNKNEMIIEAGFGLGEAIVGGVVTPDSYVVSKKEMMLLDIHIGHQSKKLERKKTSSTKFSEQGNNEWTELGEEGKRQKLSGQKIIELATLCNHIEKHYSFPCDIEWAFANGQFFITQSRPITTLNF